MINTEVNLAALLRPLLILCRLPQRSKEAVLQELAGAVIAAHGPGIDPQELLDAITQREKMGPMPLGKGLAFCHARTEKISELNIALAICPAGVEDFIPPDGIPVRVVLLFLIPRQHSDLYLRAMSALLRQLSKPDLMEESVAAENPEQVIAILSSESTSPDMATVSALFAGGQDGAEPAAQILARTPPAYLAELVEDLTPADRSQFLAKLDPVRAAQVVDQMHLIPAAAAIRRMSSEASARILGYVEIAHCAVILRQLNPEEQAAILKHLTARERTGVQTVLKYPPSTAGGIMTPEVLSVKEDATVADALNAMASFPDRRQIDIYVINSQGRLAGKCLIHDLLGVQPHAKISAVMQQNMTTVQPERDQEELRHMVARSDLRSMPVVGPQGNLLGVVTEDDILDVVEQEAGEDIALMVGVKMVDPIHTPIQTRIRMRLPWLLLTLGGELFIALVISKFFSSTLERAVVLAAFIPAIMATGGNVGLQSTTMVIRGLGMGTLKPKHTWRLISGEVKLGFLTGLGCGLIAALVAYLINWNYHEVLKVSFSVFLAMVSATFATSLIGTLEPIVLHRLKFDPATACGPFVTMFNDMFGSIVYLLIASFMHFSPP